MQVVIQARDFSLADFRTVASRLEQSAILTPGYLSEFVRQIEETTDTPKRLLFATSGRALSQLAPMLIHYSEDTDQEGHLANRLEAWWPKAEASRIASRFKQLVARLGEQDPQVQKVVAPDFIDLLTAQVEAEVQSWRQSSR